MSSHTANAVALFVLYVFIGVSVVVVAGLVVPMVQFNTQDIISQVFNLSTSQYISELVELLGDHKRKSYISTERVFAGKLAHKSIGVCAALHP